MIKMGSATLFGLGSAAALERFLGASTETVSAAGSALGSAAGQQGIPPVRWGMFVDMSKCVDDCQDCIDVCHVRHNVPRFDSPKEEIKWIWKQGQAKVFPSQSQEFPAEQLTGKPVLTFCIQCAEPPCVKVCPTQATFIRPDGIVEMDFHRCIGCRFCMAGCPYGARSFNYRQPRPYIENPDPGYPTREIGVVEKCNFCAERIDVGKEPSCVETCQSGVLVFGNLNDPDSEIRRKLKTRVTFTRKPELGTRPSVFYAFENGND